MRPSASFAELRTWATGAGIGLILLIIAADSYEAWQDYQRVVRDNARLQMALSRSVSEHAARLMQSADVVLASAADTGSADDAFFARARALPFVQAAAVIDATGRIVAASEAAVLGTDVHGRPVFTAAAQEASAAATSAAALLIDCSTDASITTPTFTLGRRVTRDGKFAGAVVLRIASGYLADFYADIHINTSTAIVLACDDGAVLARFPPDAPFGNTSRELPRAAVVRVMDRGVEYVATAFPVGGYALTAVVSRSWSSVLGPWWQEERSSAARTVSLAALAGLLLLTLRQALKKQQRADAEKRRLEQELAVAQRVEALGFLAASVAHDFNNVLTAIVGYAELTRETVAATPQPAENIDRLLAATERARMLVRRVLTFNPHRSLQYLPVHVEPIVSEVAEQTKATLPRSVKLELGDLQSTSIILGDATEVYQVAVNLTTNAIHAMPNGGTLQMSLSEVEISEPKPLRLGKLKPGRWVTLTVTDSGIGMSAEQMSAMFETFYTTRQSGHGTGIGLAVVRNIILRMNGGLDVDSRVDAGTRMTVYWPALNAPMLKSTRVDAESSGAGETIMVVDDEAELVALTEDLLASLSYEPVGFADARAALEALAANPGRFHGMLTDERMQPMRGLELAAEAHKLQPDLPIILMTGQRDAETDRRAAEVGILEILDKPLRINTLREALARRLRKPA